MGIGEQAHISPGSLGSTVITQLRLPSCLNELISLYLCGQADGWEWLSVSSSPFLFPSARPPFCADSGESSVRSAIQLIHWDRKAMTFDHYMNYGERITGCRGINFYSGNSLVGIIFYCVQLIILCISNSTACLFSTLIPSRCHIDTFINTEEVLLFPLCRWGKLRHEMLNEPAKFPFLT